MESENDVTLVITACNRPFLLKPTLESFMKYNTYPIKECIIIEDSGLQGIDDFAKDILKDIPLKLIYNEKRIGQIKSIDKAYKEVKTKYIFHCEEDWEFIDYGFIEASMNILEKDDKMFTVFLRSYNCVNRQPIVIHDDKPYNIMSTNYVMICEGKKFTWHGITFNPGLRRTSTCMLFHPYSEIDTGHEQGVGEYDVNVKYGELGFYSPITKNYNGYVKHIGWGYHIY